ncbi:MULTISPECIES: TetR/AcrR family transcriptional regulator [unclassified Gordonia (in: high G+C Gram-positive bacteria)]
MTADQVSPRSEIRKSAGRPRDEAIDGAVIGATRELLVDVGYARLTMSAVAERAGTTKTAIYRRWTGKPDLVHDATLRRFTTLVSQTGDLDADLASMIAEVREVFGSPVTRAALPGLIADMAADPALHRQVLEGFGGVFGAVGVRLEAARDAGAIGADVDATLLIEMLGGAAILHTLMRPEAPLDDYWGMQMKRMVAAILAPASSG